MVSSFCCIVEAAQIFPEIFGSKNEKVITLIAFSILIKMSKLMKAFLAGIREKVLHLFRQMSLRH